MARCKSDTNYARYVRRADAAHRRQCVQNGWPQPLTLIESSRRYIARQAAFKERLDAKARP